MQITIDISKDDYEECKRQVMILGRGICVTVCGCIKYAVANGIPMKNGKWIENKWGEETCSECGYTHKAEGSNFCPNCGSYNGGGDENNN